MYNIEEFKNWLFIDIETVSNTESLTEYTTKLGSTMLDHWANKTKYIRQNMTEDPTITDSDLYTSHAALYPEFGKVIVISIGQVKFEGDEPIPKIRSIYGHTEDELLTEFMGVMQSIFNKNPLAKLVGHNINKFDLPYLLKRSIVHNIQIPSKLHLQKLKPWETCLLDTMDIWKFGNYNGSATLSLICDLLQIPSPKQNMHGIETTHAYWVEDRLDDIKEYCEADVIATMNLMLRLSNLPIIK